MSNAILQMLANPTVPDIVGGFNAGQDRGMRNNMLQQQAMQQKVKQGRDTTKYDQGQKQEKLKAISRQALLAKKLGAGEQREKVLGNISTIAGNDPELQAIASGLVSIPEGKEREGRIDQILDFSRKAGLLAEVQAQGATKDNRTAEIKNFEYGQKNPDFLVKQRAKQDAAATKLAAGKSYKNTTELRKEFLSQSGEFQKVRDAYTRVISSVKEPSAAGDLALIFNYMKMLDPRSVVRESEFATAASTGSYGDRIQASVQKVLSGERLSPKMRADFFKKSGSLMKGSEEQHKKRVGSYRRIAEKNNLDPADVVVDILRPEEQAADQQPTTIKFLGFE